MTTSEMVTDNGKDREQILSAGTKSDGKVTWYTPLAGDSYKGKVKAFATKYPRMLFEIIIRSSIASGRVTRPDLHQARGVAGIKAVIAPAGKPIDRFAY